MKKRLKDYETEARTILEQMSIRERVLFSVGKDSWHLHGLEQYGLPEVMITDGPHGLRKEEDGTGLVNFAATLPSTAFPTASATACSFDPELLYEMGKALGEECVKEKVAVLLGPGVNHKRSPLCGRNFEYFSEDPFLSGTIGAALVSGIEDCGIGTSVKHYAGNNQETARLRSNSIIDERALHEIYLRQYEQIVKEAQPSTIMVSYNRINGSYATESRYLLTDVARTRWGYEGLFLSDWGAINDLVESFENGLDLEMPGMSQERIKAICDGVLDGSVSLEQVEETALRSIELILRAKDAFDGRFTDGKTGKAAADMEAHADLARIVAEESAVLLKNEDAVLPLNRQQRIGVFGNFAEKPRYQGAGSSQLIPYRLSTPLDAFREAGIDIVYSEGYGSEETTADSEKIQAAAKVARTCDVCVVFAGLPGSFESEGFDRTVLDMPDSHNRLVSAVAAANPNTVVVLQMGAPVVMPWLSEVKAVLCMYLAGECVGAAAVNLLTGAVNPSGRLAETFPLCLEDTPCYGNYANSPYHALYKESIFTGYRYYDTSEREVLFPFGFGSSYTTFDYSNLNVTKLSDGAEPQIRVSVDVTNTGNRSGKEVVQVYVGQQSPTLFKARKELKAFRKLDLQPGETQTVTLTLDRRAFDYWNTDVHRFVVDSGRYEVFVCRNVSDVVLSEAVELEGERSIAPPDYRTTAPEYYRIQDGTLRHADDIPTASFAAIYGSTPDLHYPLKPYDRSTTLGDLAEGKVVSAVRNIIRKLPLDDTSKAMFHAMAGDAPLKELHMAGVSMKTVDRIAALLNKDIHFQTKKEK